MVQSWMNNDGLYIKYGVDRGTAGIGGNFAYPADGGQTVVEYDIVLKNLGTSAAILDDNNQLPQNARIEKIEIKAITAGVGSGAVLNVGLQRSDRTTEYDYDGLLAAVPVTDFDAANETHTYTVVGSSAGGVLVGTTLAHNGYLTADYDTAAFTDGILKVKIFYVVAANRTIPWTA